MAEHYTREQSEIIGEVFTGFLRLASSHDNSHPGEVVFDNDNPEVQALTLRLMQAHLHGNAVTALLSNIKNEAVEIVSKQRVTARQATPNEFAPLGPGRQRHFGDGQPVQSLRHDRTEGLSDRPLAGRHLPILPNKPRE